MARTRISRRSVLGRVGAASLAPAWLPARNGSPPSFAADAIAPEAAAAFSVRLQVGPAQPAQQVGAAHSCSLCVLGGEVEGPLLRGAVQGGQIHWRRDPARQLLELSAHINVLRPDGTLVEIIDRTLHPDQDLACCTAALCLRPELVVAGDPTAAGAVLVGRLDASGLHAGHLRLLAFRVS